MAVDTERDEREVRAGQNQTLFREVNERVKELNESLRPLGVPRGDWVCECADETCSAGIQMTLEEYEALRAGGTRFAVAPDESHVFPEVESLVERHEHYWVVEKRGESAAVTAHFDPRSRPRLGQ